MPYLSAKQGLRILVVVVAPAICASRQVNPSHSFTLVNCCDSKGLAVFPFDGAAFTIPLPFVPRTVVFSPKGNALYAIRPSAPGGLYRSSLVKIQFHPTRVNPVWESADLEIGDFSVSMSEDKIVFAGRPRDRADRTCGLFEINLPGEKVRRVLENSDCRKGFPWSEITLCSDGERAITKVGRDLELVDLMHGTVKPLGIEFSKGPWDAGAVWSQDGKWLAVMEAANRGRLFLLDSSDLSRKRALRGGSHRMTPVWSPDSRYLVRGKVQLRCGISFDVDTPFTLEVVEIESGKGS
jgi:hypothetical protein